MKKILLATTMLAGTAGFAAAEVTLSGYAEMGIAGGSEVNTQFHQDVDVTFTMSGETDSGLSFGTSIDLSEAGDIDSNGSAYDVFVSGSFGKITMGDTDGALDWAVTEVAMGSALGDDHTAHAGYSGNGGFDLTEAGAAGIGLDGLYDGQVVRFEHSFGDFSAAVSLEMFDAEEVTAFGADWAPNSVIGLGAKYSANGLSVGVGYQTATVDNLTVDGEDIDFEAVALSAGYTVNNFDLRANIGRTSLSTPNEALALDVDHVGLGVGYTMDALMVSLNWGEFTRSRPGVEDASQSGFGLAANYDLGGGASAQLGYGSSSFNDGTDASTFSAGLALSF
jgi:outer membrane protein OmpU